MTLSREPLQVPSQVPQLPPDPVAEPQLPQDPVAELLDRDWYLRTNGDVAAAQIDPLTHFLQNGEAEGRNPSPNFSLKYYRDSYMAGLPADSSPTRHYLDIGRARGFNPDGQSEHAYQQFVLEQNQRFGLEATELRWHVDAMVRKPNFVVYLQDGNAAAAASLRRSLELQAYSHWTVHTDWSELCSWVTGAGDADWCLVWLGKDDQLHAGALYSYASALNAAPDSDIVYADEDECDELGRRSHPFFKPDWSPDYLEAFNYIGTGCCIDGRACTPFLAEADGFYDLLLRTAEVSRRVLHLRHVLVHRRTGLDRPRPAAAVDQDAKALGRRLQRTGRSGEITPLFPDRGCFAVRLVQTAAPLVSVVIPTAGRTIDVGGRKVDLLSNCLEHLLDTTSYKTVEIVVIHNDDLGDARIASLEAQGVRLVTYRGDFNVARKLNIGAEASRGEFLLLLNDDVEPITPDWVERMLDQAQKPHVGAVGAKLLYPARQIQHAGIVMVDAKPGHVRSNYPQDDEGYFFSTCAPRNYSAVTGAVMLTPASLYRQVGGYAEELPVNFNDVDYCLKVGRAGYYSVYAPQAELVHYESASRVREVKAFEVECIERRWADFTRDPFYNQTVLRTDGADFRFLASRSSIG